MNIYRELKEEMKHYQDSDPEKSKRIKKIVDYIECLHEDLHKEHIHRISDVQNLQTEIAFYKNKVKQAIKILNGNKENENES